MGYCAYLKLGTGKEGTLRNHIYRYASQYCVKECTSFLAIGGNNIFMLSPELVIANQTTPVLGVINKNSLQEEFRIKLDSKAHYQHCKLFGNGDLLYLVYIVKDAMYVFETNKELDSFYLLFLVLRMKLRTSNPKPKRTQLTFNYH